MTTRSSPESTGRTGRRALAAAAVVVALVGAMVATRLVTGDDQGVSVTTDSPGEPNGWYLPVGLPDGWHPLTVELSRAPLPCPCREATWSDASSDRSVELRSYGTITVDETLENSPGLPVDLGPDATAILDGDGAPGSDARFGLVWEADGRTALLDSTGLTAEQVVEVGRVLVADPLAGDLSIDGLESEAVRRGQALVDGRASVTVTYRAPSGHRVDYSLSLPDRSSAHMGAERYVRTQLEGQSMPVLRGEPHTFVGYDYTNYIGRWPGATASANGGVGVLRAGNPTVTPGKRSRCSLRCARRPPSSGET